MTTSSPERVFELLRSALDLPPELRGPFLAAECRDQPAIRAEVEALLSADERAGDPDGSESIGVGLDLVRRLGTTPQDLDQPIDAGRYRLLRVIGRGGMGVVYEAEQDQPKRHIAIKLISFAAMGPPALVRFRREIELLGRLSHPGIAQIHDAGALTMAGAEQPFYAMELIDGEPISDYARRRTLSIPERLDLIAQVCDAVQHAHHKGVIHRDIKPANVLVTGDGAPKVLDFGIARAVGTTVHHSVEATATGVALGTLGYMSPEQVAGQNADIDARTDIYALGALAYEILTGRPPHDVADATLAGAFRAVTDLPPTRPSTINASLRGDIETILLTALEKEPARRYQSAGEMAADIRRAIAGEPIAAHPPSAMYRIRKFAKRNRALVTGVALAFAILVVGTIVSTSLAIYASSQRVEADRQRAAADLRSYKASIAAAAYAIELNDVAAALRHLKIAPVELRGWEWHHLCARTTNTIQTASPSEPERVARWLGMPTYEPPAGHAINGRQLHHVVRHTLNGGGRTVIDIVDSELVEREAQSGDVVRRTPLPPHSNRYAIDPDTDRLALLLQRDDKAATGFVVLTFDGAEVLRGDGELVIRAVALTGDRLFVFRRDFGRTLRCRLSVFDLRDRILIVETEFKSDHDSLASNGEVVALSGEGPVIDLLSARTLEPMGELRGHPRGPVRELAFNSDGRLLASRSPSEVVVWDAEAWAPLTITAVLSNPKRRGRRMAFAPGPDRLVAVDRTGAAHLLDCRPGGFARLTGHETYVYHVCFSPDGAALATVDYAGGVRVWDARTLEQRGTARVSARPRTAEMIDDGTLVTLGPGTSIDIATMAAEPIDVAGDFRGPLDERLLEARQTLAHQFPGGAQYVVDERFVVTSEDRSLVVERRSAATNTLAITNARDGQSVAEVMLDRGASAARFRPDGATLVIADKSGALSLIDTYTGEVLRRSAPTQSTIHALSLSPDGARIATGSRDGVLRLWDTESLELVAELRAHSAYIFDLAFSPDGTQIATASGDHTVGVWSTQRPAGHARTDAVPDAPAP